MTKQKEIKEGIAKRMAEAHGFDWEKLKEKSIHREFYRQLAGEITVFEDSQDVVIRGNGLGGTHPHLANYYTVLPLIEGE